MISLNNCVSRDSAFNMLRILAKQKMGLNIVHLNAQSLHSKMDEFRHTFASSGIDIICISETWFRFDFNDSFYSLQGFNLFRSDRSIVTDGQTIGSRGGGVAIYVRCGLTCSTKFKSMPGSEVDYLFLEVTAARGRKMLVACVYKPHRNISIESIVHTLEDISVSYNDIIILGDFNNNLLINNSICDLMSSLGLSPVNTETPTYYHWQSNSLIDLVFVNNITRIFLYDQSRHLPFPIMISYS